MVLRIKKLYLEGTSSPKDKRTFRISKKIEALLSMSFIESMKAGKSPVKITADELAKRPKITGANQAGAAGERLQDLQTYVSDFKKEKLTRLPTMSELRTS